MSVFEWTTKKQKAALALARGCTETQAAADSGVSDRTIRRWKHYPDFAAEVDRLSLMVDIAGRAERLRIVMRAVRQKIAEDGTLITDKDLLDWLKFAQSETDGVRLDLVKLQEAMTGE